MILLLEKQAQVQEINNLLRKLEWMNLKAILTQNEDQKAIAIIDGIDKNVDFQQFESLAIVAKIKDFTGPYKLV